MYRTPTKTFLPFFAAFAVACSPGSLWAGGGDRGGDRGNGNGAGGSLAQQLADQAKHFAKEVKQDLNQGKQEGKTAKEIGKDIREDVKDLKKEVKKDLKEAGANAEQTEKVRDEVKEIVGKAKDKMEAAFQEAKDKAEAGTKGDTGKGDDGKGDDGKKAPPASITQAISQMTAGTQALTQGLAVVPAPSLISATNVSAGAKNALGDAAGGDVTAVTKTTPLGQLHGVTGVKDAEALAASTARRTMSGATAAVDRLPGVGDVRPAVEAALSQAVELPKDQGGVPAAEAKTSALLHDARRSAGMAKEYKRAEAEASEVLQSDPQNGEALQIRAEARLKQGNPAGAAADAEAATKADPKDPKNWLMWTDALHALGNTDEALRVIDQALKLHPRDAVLFVRQAALLEQAGRHGDALDALAEAARLNARYEAAYEAALKGGKIRYPDFDEDFVTPELGRGARRHFGPVGVALALGCLSCLGAALWLMRRRQPEGVNAIGARKRSATDSVVFSEKYETVHSLAKGFGELVEAKDRTLERTVAVRRLPSGGDAAKRTLLAEAARAAGAIRHRALLDVYEVLEDGDDVCVVTELPRGKTVAQLLSDAGKLPFAQAVAVLEPVCDALSAAHAQGISHRRLSPEQIMITDQGQTKVFDLGAAPDAGDDGTRADVHGLAATLYEMTTGAKPFADDAADGRAGLAYVPPSERLAGLPPGLDELMGDALAPSPRPAIAGVAEFLARLKALNAPVRIGAAPAGTGASPVAAPR